MESHDAQSAEENRISIKPVVKPLTQSPAVISREKTSP